MKAAASAALSQGKQPAEIKFAPLPVLPPGLAEAMQTRIRHGDEGVIAYARTWIDQASRGGSPVMARRLGIASQPRTGRAVAELSSQLTGTYTDDGPLTFLSAVAWRRVGRKDKSP
jgi:hypothetical protein